MRTISEAELKDIIEKHQLWLLGKEGGERADLSYSNLSRANLSGANLYHANLRGANLCFADLSGADLRGANLHDADLRGANLHRADLFIADLYDANLHGTNLHNAVLYGADLHDSDLSGSNLHNANLRGADMHGVDLRGADMCGTDLRGADMSGTDLRGANLYGANMRGVKNIDNIIWDNSTTFSPIQCLESGAFVGYKKASGHIVKLEICEDALRSSATTRKCRCSKAKVLEIQNYDGTPSGLTSVASNYDYNFIYTVGEIIEVKDFDTNRWNECAPGIHFFITRDEAVKYC